MKEIVLISIAGDDRPGITSMVTGILAAHSINVLDIGQAVIHNNLALGLLVEIPEHRETSAALRELLVREPGNGTAAALHAGQRRELPGVGGGTGQGKAYRDAVVAADPGEEIARLSEVVARHGLNIDKIMRLSGRVSADAAAVSDRACVEFSVRGELADPATVRRDFLELASELGVDIAYQEDNMFRRTRRLVAFDMDSTLIEAEVIDELAKRAGSRRRSGRDHRAGDARRAGFQREFPSLGLPCWPGSTNRYSRKSLPSCGSAKALKSWSVRCAGIGFRTAIISGGFSSSVAACSNDSVSTTCLPMSSISWTAR